MPAGTNRVNKNIRQPRTEAQARPSGRADHGEHDDAEERSYSYPAFRCRHGRRNSSKGYHVYKPDLSDDGQLSALDTTTTAAGIRTVLNVGGNSKAIAIPAHYDGWRHDLLDIDPAGDPDILCDARELLTLPGMAYDSIYCSHNLEHYYAHDVPKVLKGFMHMLKSDGFAYIRVPDLDAVMQTYVKRKMDITDVLYQSPSGPIMVRDVLYGFGKKIEQSGEDFYAHKTGFTPTSLQKVILKNGFRIIGITRGNLEIRAIAFKGVPRETDLDMLGFDSQKMAEALSAKPIPD